MDTDKRKLKKISVDELKVGMFIVNLGRSWISHPFFRNQLKIDSPKKIEKLKKCGIPEVFIDPERGLDIPSPKVESEGINPRPEFPSPPSQTIGVFSKQVAEPVSSAGVLPSSPYKDRAIADHDPDDSLQKLEKSESVAFWEENIGQGG
ncbi:MAG: putative metal-dependent phosphohydrolase region, partial [Deltaproteobacteria bacterium]|nr:putative metal-dependent phosphohydrolase region [Deltaproteobacteria bacterium]